MVNDTKKRKSELIAEIQDLRNRLENLEKERTDKQDALLSATFHERIALHSHTERALRESEEKYRKVLEQASDGICIVQDLMLTYCNLQFADILGMTTEELIGSPVTRYIDPAELPHELLLHENRQAGKPVPHRYERTLLRNDGKKIQVEANISLITHENKQATLVIVRDITERKKAEEEIRKSNQQLSTLNAIHSVIVTCRSGEELSDKLAQHLHTVLPIDSFILDAYDPETGDSYGFGNYDTLDGKFQRVSPCSDNPTWHEGIFKVPLFEEKRTILISRTPEEIRNTPKGFRLFGDTSRRSASLIYLPLIVGGRVTGVLSIHSYQPNIFTPENVKLAEAVGRQIAPALEGILLAEKLKKNASELRRSEDYLRAFIEALPDVAFVMDEDGRYVDVLSTHDDLLLKKKNVIVGTLLSEHFPPEETKRFVDVIRRTIETNEFHVCEYQIDVPAGHRWFEGRTSPMKIKTPAGKSTVVWIARDITAQKEAKEALKQARDHLEIRVRARTAELEELNRNLKHEIVERRQAEDALRENEENFRTFFESMIEIMVVSSPDGQILFTNQAAQEKLGYSARELAKMHFLDWHPAAEQKEAEKLFKSVLKGERESYTLPLNTKEGSQIPVEIRVWFGKWSGAICVFSVCKDLSAEQEAQQRFERIFNYNPTPMALTNSFDLRFLDVNDAFSQTTGYPREEVLGRTTSELNLFVNVHDQNLAGKRLRSEGSIAGVELQIIRKDGTIRDGLFSGEVISGQGTKYFLTVMVDITDRKLAEQALRESEARYRGLIESQEDLVVRFDTEGRYTFVNDAYCRKFGFERETILGRPFTIQEQPGNEQHDLDIMKPLHTPPYRGSAEKQTITAEGRRWIHWEVCSIRDKQDKVLEYQAVGRDVTEFRLAVQAMQESERKYRSLFENASDAIFLINREGQFLDINSAMSRLTGFTEKELLHMNILSIYVDASNWSDLQEKIEWEGAGQDFEVRFWRKNGGMVDCHVTADIHRDSDDKILGYQGIARDITERKQAERQREKLDRMQREFVANVSHELKTPLTSIQGYAETLISGSRKDPKTVKDFLEIIQDNAVRLSHLTDDLLQLSQVEAGHLKMEMRILHPIDLIEGCLKIVRPKAAWKKINLESKYPEVAPLIRGDAYRLREVFQNLLDNAIHYSPEGSTVGIEIRADRHKWLQFNVIDKGIGIAPKDQERVFERFFRVDTARSRKAGGTGLGLSIVRQLVEAHQGRIELESELGKGSIFSVFLPVDGPDEA